MSKFNAADYGITWPTEPRDIIKEALREYVGDGDGADEAVLAEHDREVARNAWEEGYEARAEDVPAPFTHVGEIAPECDYTPNPYEEEQ